MAKENWNKRAANFLKAELAKHGVSYETLTTKLNAIGVEDTYQAVASKINRGTFSFAFFLQCMQALRIKDIRL